MNSRLRNMVLIVGCVAIAFIALLFIPKGKSSEVSGATKQSANQKFYANWDEDYSINSVQPYGLKQFNTLLKASSKFPVGQIDYLYSLDTVEERGHANYVYVGRNFVLYEEEIEQLLDYVYEGSNLLVSAEVIDAYFLESFFSELDRGFVYDTTFTIEDSDRSYSFVSKYQGYTVANEWFGVLNYATIDSLEFQALAGTDKLCTDFKIPYGEGFVYIQTNPEFFANYQLLNKDAHKNAISVISNLKDDYPIYWLEMGRYTNYTNRYYYDNDGISNTSKLDFIFSDTKRSLAFGLLIGGLILLVIFRSKRTEPIVAYREEKPNMTMKFVETITSIYFNKRNPRNLLSIQRVSFINAVQKHFNIDLSREVDDMKLHSLAQKSKVNEEVVKDIYRSLTSKVSSDFSEEELTDIRTKILNFYREAGMHSAKYDKRKQEQVVQLYRGFGVTIILLLAGILLFMLGMYYLTKSQAIGILFWPLAALPIIISVRRMMKPYVTFSNEQLSVHPLFGKEVTYQLDKFRSVQVNEQEATLVFSTSELKINFLVLNNLDAKRLRSFVESLT